MPDISNQVVEVRSNGEQSIILVWPDMRIYLSIENAKKLIDGLINAVTYEEGLKTHER